MISAKGGGMLQVRAVGLAGNTGLRCKALGMKLTLPGAYSATFCQAGLFVGWHEFIVHYDWETLHLVVFAWLMIRREKPETTETFLFGMTVICVCEFS